MSNLSRKVKKATEPFENKAKRRRKKLERRINAATTNSPFPKPSEARIRAVENLSEEQQSALLTDLGVTDLDRVKFTCHIKWQAGIGWYPEWQAEVMDETR